MELEASLVIKPLLCFLVVGLLMVWGWRILNWVWLKPKRLEKCLRQQGFTGNSYRFLSGDMKEISVMTKQASAKPMPLSDDIVPYVAPFVHQTVRNYGLSQIMDKIHRKITNPGEIREIFTKFNDFQKPFTNPLVKLLATGLADLEGDKWAKHRKIINPVFQQDKLKNQKKERATPKPSSNPWHHHPHRLLKEGILRSSQCKSGNFNIVKTKGQLNN
ncbi:hypothetical protein PTKIN_Ptkin14bG0199400 [Pterospermum kingtungense]